ncbi:MAG: hypothetical protein AAF539_14965 [Planctomycetota bacterium]
MSHFYTPLYGFVAQQARLADLPRWFLRPPWNALDQAGMPLAGETTTAVYYPIRMLVYAFDAPIEQSMGWYVTFHLILASWTAWWCARCVRLDKVAASLAGIVYPLSGGVLFLGTNPPFLVGAAWMPLVMTALAKRDRRPRPRDVIVPAVALAMMILGGDPHLAFLTIVTLIAIMLASGDPWVRKRQQAHKLAMVGMLAAVISMPQLVASIQWTWQSDRVANQISDAEAYAYSLSPWRISELFLPNLFGTPWPINDRWDRALFAGGQVRSEDALWTPSVYAGAGACLAILVLALRATRRRRLTRRDRMWSVVLLLSFTGAMGGYGPAYFLNLIPGLQSPLPSAFGGPTWFLRIFVPGYDALRYPSKWLPLTMLALAIATARGFELLQRRPSTFQRARWIWLLLVVVIATVLFPGWYEQQIRDNGLTLADTFWGPLQWPAILSTYRIVVVHGVPVALGLVIAHRLPRRPAWIGLILVMDMMFAHHNLLPVVNRSQEQQLLSDLATKPDELTNGRWLRINQAGTDLWPAEWKRQSHIDRLLAVEISQRRSWFGRWHLEHNQAVFNSMVSIQSSEVASFWRQTRIAFANMNEEQRQQYWRQQYKRWDIGGRVIVGDDIQHPELLSPILDVNFELLND